MTFIDDHVAVTTHAVIYSAFADETLDESDIQASREFLSPGDEYTQAHEQYRIQVLASIDL